jgi:CDP-diacylglycerol--serine O-phosphatidyltransferase
MVSKLPAWSGKRFGSRIPRDKVMLLFVCVVLFVAVLVTWPWATLAVLCAAYLAALPFSALRYARLARDYAARHPAAAIGPDGHAGTAHDDERHSHLN